MEKVTLRVGGHGYTFRGFSEMTSDRFTSVTARIANEPSNAYPLVLTEFFGMPKRVLDTVHIPSLGQVDFEKILSSDIGMYKLKDSYFGLELPDLGDITIGRFTDTELFFSKLGESRVASTVAMVLLRENGTAKQLEALTVRIGAEMKLGDLLAVFNMYTIFRTGIFKNYEGLFNQQVREEESEESEESEGGEQDGWGWMGAVYSLANDDITKVDEINGMKLVKCLNFMSYRKEEADRMSEQMKKNE